MCNIKTRPSHFYSSADFKYLPYFTVGIDDVRLFSAHILKISTVFRAFVALSSCIM